MEASIGSGMLPVLQVGLGAEATRRGVPGRVRFACTFPNNSAWKGTAAMNKKDPVEYQGLSASAPGRAPQRGSIALDVLPLVKITDCDLER